MKLRERILEVELSPCRPRRVSNSRVKWDGRQNPSVELIAVLLGLGLRMRQKSPSSVVPNGTDHTVYIVLDDLGPIGMAWRGVDVERISMDIVINDLLDGQY